MQPTGEGGVGFSGGRLRERRAVSLGTRQMSDASKEAQKTRGRQEHWAQLSSALVLRQDCVQRQVPQSQVRCTLRSNALFSGFMEPNFLKSNSLSGQMHS